MSPFLTSPKPLATNCPIPRQGLAKPSSFGAISVQPCCSRAGSNLEPAVVQCHSIFRRVMKTTVRRCRLHYKCMIPDDDDDVNNNSDTTLWHTRIKSFWGGFLLCTLFIFFCFCAWWCLLLGEKSARIVSCYHGQQW